MDGKALPLGFWKDLLESISEGVSFLDSFQQVSSKYPEVALIGMEGSKGQEKEADESREIFLRELVQANSDEIFIVINGRVSKNRSLTGLGCMVFKCIYNLS